MIPHYLVGMLHEIPHARRDTIAARLGAGQSVSSSLLASEFGVSEDAIRRDLRGLAAEGLCRRVYGGALPLQAQSRPMIERVSERTEEKRALARAAAALIEPGNTVFLDNGSTNLMVAKMLPDIEVTVATNSVVIASALLGCANVQLLMMGGAVDPVVGGCIDAMAIEMANRLNIDVCFLGACAVSAGAGIGAYEVDDAMFKRAIVGRSRSIIVLATNDKLGARATHSVAELGTITRIVVENDAPDSVVDELKAAGGTVVRAAAELS